MLGQVSCGARQDTTPARPPSVHPQPARTPTLRPPPARLHAHPPFIPSPPARPPSVHPQPACTPTLRPPPARLHAHPPSIPSPPSRPPSVHPQPACTPTLHPSARLHAHPPSPSTPACPLPPARQPICQHISLQARTPALLSTQPPSLPLLLKQKQSQELWHLSEDHFVFTNPYTFPNNFSSNYWRRYLLAASFLS
ncbi:hypothetical protein Pcinc_033742 [Petrolisthes cinctipes]|uniref:Uncharacterized protein n=1 Tax=Petrolisthes cinctipes TaxID=88211 RepID=A0AAE1ERT1_PETCI|nr:hypothetical protein Pcinc_033742 [Petrolisthes cinctipes]